MNQPIIFLDLEGTLSAGEMWRGVGRYLQAHGQGAAYRQFFITHLPGVWLGRLGLVDKQTMRARWLDGLTLTLKGKTAAEIETLSEWVVEHELWPQRRQAVLDEIIWHQQAGAQVVLASGAYLSVLTAFARRLGNSVEVIGTPLEFIAERATGKFAGPHCVGAEKTARVRHRAASAEVLAAYGDTLGDAEMLALSRQPVAVAPDKELARLAQQRGWRVMSG
ncbi:MAG: HAD-IB family phosphatase [Anaerolineales bacterium]|nr:HAD-IB family phosphatase [Anaerolineales bacterium]